jgi:hypothetical protein
VGGALRANRVEEGFGEGTLGFRLGKQSKVLGSSGYSTGVERIAASVAVTTARSIQGELKLGLSAGYDRGVARRYDSDMYHHAFNSVQALSGLDDYFDYSWR